MTFFRSSVWDRFFYTPNRNWVVDEELRTEEISLRTSDNKRLVCLYIHSDLPKKEGVIFLLHGNDGNAAQYAQYEKPLIKEGFDIFIVDWRGYGKSEGHPNHHNVIEDSVLALNYFFSREEVRQHKKILLGLSLGGQVAIHLSKKFPGRIDALVTEGSVASFTQAVLDYYPGIIGSFFQHFISKPYSAEEDIRSLVNLPKLFIHSKDDKEISPKNAAILFANAQEPKFCLTISGKHLFGLNKQNRFKYIEAFKKIVNGSNCTNQIKQLKSL